MESTPVTQICLLSDEFTSLITPIIDPDIPSDRVIIVARERHHALADNLVRLAKTRGYQAEFWRMPSSERMVDIKLNLINLFEREQQAGQTLWLNASHGSRYQALAAYDVARMFDASVYVVEPERDQLFWLRPDNKAPTPIQDKLKLHEYFSVLDAEYQPAAHGQVEKSHRDLGAQWLAEADRMGDALAKLNYLAFKADNPQLTARQSADALNDTDLQTLLDDASDIDILRRDRDEIIFSDEAARFFCNGGWLEEYVFSLVNSLRPALPTLQDQAQSARIRRPVQGKTVNNELDVIALVNNKLHIIECKTKRYNRHAGRDAIYKLDSLTELLGGGQGRAALVTYQPLHQTDLLRAAELDIAVFDRHCLANLKQHLLQWFSQAQGL